MGYQGYQDKSNNTGMPIFWCPDWRNLVWKYPDQGYQDWRFPDQGYPDQGCPNQGYQHHG